jgi:hypothetical protein
LGAGHAFPVGESPSGFQERLRAFSRACDESILTLGWGIFAGSHRCEFCRQFNSSLNFGVSASSILYVCPEMISHYVEAHDYLPPTNFITAVLSAPLPGSDEYTRAVQSFLGPFAETYRLIRG